MQQHCWKAVGSKAHWCRTVHRLSLVKHLISSEQLLPLGVRLPRTHCLVLQASSLGFAERLCSFWKESCKSPSVISLHNCDAQQFRLMTVLRSNNFTHRLRKAAFPEVSVAPQGTHANVCRSFGLPRHLCWSGVLAIDAWISTHTCL
jgi:hypothetical protein